MADTILSTFVLVNSKNEVISPVLTTTRVYGSWLEDIFDSSVCGFKLYLKSVKRDGERTIEKHPGTRIGDFFDHKDFSSEKLKSWFIMQDSEVMDRLVKMKLAEKKDAIPISVNDEEGRRMIRLYTIDQINVFIQMKLDKSFNIANFISTPKQVKISDSDIEKMIKPQVNKARKRLF